MIVVTVRRTARLVDDAEEKGRLHHLDRPLRLSVARREPQSHQIGRWSSVTEQRSPHGLLLGRTRTQEADPMVGQW
jgi:hypothetical protein